MDYYSSNDSYKNYNEPYNNYLELLLYEDIVYEPGGFRRIILRKPDINLDGICYIKLKNGSFFNLEETVNELEKHYKLSEYMADILPLQASIALIYKRNGGDLDRIYNSLINDIDTINNIGLKYVDKKTKEIDEISDTYNVKKAINDEKLMSNIKETNIDKYNNIYNLSISIDYIKNTLSKFLTNLNKQLFKKEIILKNYFDIVNDFDTVCRNKYFKNLNDYKNIERFNNRLFTCYEAVYNNKVEYYENLYYDDDDDDISSLT